MPSIVGGCLCVVQRGYAYGVSGVTVLMCTGFIVCHGENNFVKSGAVYCIHDSCYSYGPYGKSNWGVPQSCTVISRTLLAFVSSSQAHTAVSGYAEHVQAG